MYFEMIQVGPRTAVHKICQPTTAPISACWFKIDLSKRNSPENQPELLSDNFIKF